MTGVLIGWGCGSRDSPRAERGSEPGTWMSALGRSGMCFTWRDETEEEMNEDGAVAKHGKLKFRNKGGSGSEAGHRGKHFRQKHRIPGVAQGRGGGGNAEVTLILWFLAPAPHHQL